MTIEQLTVPHPAGTYQINVGYNTLQSLCEADDHTPFVVVTDDNVAREQLGRFSAISAAWSDAIVLPHGEHNKTLANVAQLYEQFIERRIDRSGTVIAFGGGVIGDMAGFAAASYMRGIDVIQCPTTLLSMVDASVGGKTGVDLPQGKNLVGAFKQPVAVYADLSTLATLPVAEFRSGMAEVIKHGIIGDPALFAQLAANAVTAHDTESPSVLQKMVVDAIKVKQAVVAQDPFERTGIRATLNLGHTFGHAIEHETGYAVRHGEAVAIGMVIAAKISAELNHCPAHIPDQLTAALHAHHLPTTVPAHLDPVDLLHTMQRDKKKKGKSLHYVLIRGIGDVFTSPAVDDKLIVDTIRKQIA